MDRKLYTFIATLLVAFTTASCSGAADRGEEGASCAADTDCRADLICRNSTCSSLDDGPDCGDDEVVHEGDCVQECLHDSGCADDQRCTELRDAVHGCLPEDDVDTERDDDREVGESCTGPGQCIDGAECIGTVEGDYECMANCGEAWSLCEDGSVCTPIANGQPICYTGGNTSRTGSCRSNLGCESGLLCVGVPNQTYHCLEACHDASGGCGDHRLCRQFGDAGKGYCRHHVGRECAGSADCANDLTCSSELASDVSTDYPGGYCTQSGCEADTDCPGESVCRDHPGTDTRLCFAPCEIDADCRVDNQSGYRCLTNDFCESVSETDACRAIRDGDNLCAPPALLSGADG